MEFRRAFIVYDMHPLVCTYPRDQTHRAGELLAQACPSAADRSHFDSCMADARAQGMTWIQGLEYVIHRRNGSS